MLISNSKTNRNDPCPCGSGIKFKKCCQQIASAQSGTSSVTYTLSLLNDAIDHHRAGRTAEAERGYRAVLAQQPQQIDALHLLGVVCQQRGDSLGAVELIKRAIAL